MIDLRHSGWDKEGEPCVNIVESPAPRDLLMECQEGKALHTALRQVRIACRYYLATSKATFREALDFIAKQRHVAPQPILLHVSAHGNNEGIKLTDGQFYPWDELHSLFLDFARAGLAFSEDAKVSSIILCMSSCFGLGPWGSSNGRETGTPFCVTGRPVSKC